MLLEKVAFLEEAIEVAKEEIFEEVEAIEEGADVTESLAIIKTILTDLLHSAKHYTYVESEKGKIKVKREEKEDECHYKYSVGTRVSSVRGVYLVKDEFLKIFNLDEEDMERFGNSFRRDVSATIVKRRRPLYPGHKPSYLVEQNGDWYLVEEKDLNA